MGSRPILRSSRNISPCSQRLKPDDHVKGGGLAGAIRPEQADHLAALDLERQIVEDLPGLVALGEIQRPQYAHGLAGGGVMMMCTRCDPCSAASATMLCASRLYLSDSPRISFCPSLSHAFFDRRTMPLAAS